MVVALANTPDAACGARVSRAQNSLIQNGTVLLTGADRCGGILSRCEADFRLLEANACDSAGGRVRV